MHTTLTQIHPGLAGDLRCDCGKLLARVLDAALELKCPRCKSVVLIANGKRFDPAESAPCACADPSPSRPLLDDQDP